jgi:hypothetical protein
VRLGVRQPFRDAGERLAQALQRDTTGQRGGGGREEIAPMEGGRGAVGNRQRDDLDFGVPERRGEQAVVGPDERLSAGEKGERRPGGTDSGVHHREVHRLRWKTAPGPSADIGAGADVARGHRMGQVHQHGLRRLAQDDGLQLGDVGVGGAEIGEQGDQRHP